MKALTVVEPEVFSQAIGGLEHVLVIVQVFLFVYAAAPEPLDEDVIHRSTAPIHTDGDFMLYENSGERIAGELRALVRIENLRLRHLQ